MKGHGINLSISTLDENEIIAAQCRMIRRGKNGKYDRQNSGKLLEVERNNDQTTKSLTNWKTPNLCHHLKVRNVIVVVFFVANSSHY